MPAETLFFPCGIPFAAHSGMISLQLCPSFCAGAGWGSRGSLGVEQPLEHAGAGQQLAGDLPGSFRLGLNGSALLFQTLILWVWQFLLFLKVELEGGVSLGGQSWAGDADGDIPVPGQGRSAPGSQQVGEQWGVEGQLKAQPQVGETAGSPQRSWCCGTQR